ncbi:hypothetical protein BC937DRAFT_90667 [Endogone sp. FLAS-F59071]|nr:hypothetical protein BC937DRAFT_90667 [Endogone sp. FLAS-F59071]|eukprot:RUS16902.1 hypothetical protein BC937DRAFT_90667 [Endogone sp. FLAS-F59071]
MLAYWCDRAAEAEVVSDSWTRRRFLGGRTVVSGVRVVAAVLSLAADAMSPGSSSGRGWWREAGVGRGRRGAVEVEEEETGVVGVLGVGDAKTVGRRRDVELVGFSRVVGCGGQAGGWEGEDGAATGDEDVASVRGGADVGDGSDVAIRN